MPHTNSGLIVHTELSPFKTKRAAPITKITIHHVAGNLTVEAIGRVFTTPNRKASSNYGIDGNGRVGLYVNESDRAWTSSSPANDHAAITVEVSNSTGAPAWEVSEKAFDALIDWAVDVCRRNPGIKRANGKPGLYFDGSPKGSLTHHAMFANTNCPGPYLLGRFPEICNCVNARLDGAEYDAGSDARVNADGTGTPEIVDHWAETYWQYLRDIGMTIHDRRFDQPITRGEVFVLLTELDKARKAKGGA